MFRKLVQLVTDALELDHGWVAYYWAFDPGDDEASVMKKTKCYPTMSEAADAVYDDPLWYQIDSIVEE